MLVIRNPMLMKNLDRIDFDKLSSKINILIIDNFSEDDTYQVLNNKYKIKLISEPSPPI